MSHFVMTSWFNKGFVSSSFSLSASPFQRRKSIREASTECIMFKEMVSELKKDEAPDKCIDYFIEKFEDIPDKQMKEYEIDSEVSRIIRHLVHNAEQYFANIERYQQIVLFLAAAMRNYQVNRRTDYSVLNMINKILDTNDTQILELSTAFVQGCFNVPELLTFLFNGPQLALLWNTCFVKNINSNIVYGPIFNSVASSFTFGNLDDLKPLLNKAMIAFTENLIEPQQAPAAIQFLGYAICKVNTDDFLPRLLPIICDMVPDFDTLQFFETLILAPTNDPPAIWSALDAICADENLTIELLESALTAIYNSKQPPAVEVFSFNSFVVRILELSDQMQQIMYEILMISEIPTRADFLCWVMPLSQTGINTNYLLKITSNVRWENNTDLIIEKLLIEPEEDELQLCLGSDESFYHIAYSIIEQVSFNSEMIVPLFNRLSSLALNEEQTSINLIQILMEKTNPDVYMDEVINVISGSIPDSLMSVFTIVARKVHSFNQAFFARERLDVLDIIVESTLGLDFLAMLVIDGPIEAVDDYIDQNFDRLALSQYEEPVLKKLMLGLAQDSTLPGFIRIPSLCARINVQFLETPYDQYVYGRYATKYFTPTKEQIYTFANRYMSSELAFQICKDPDSLPYITDPLSFHYPIYQMHPSARDCSVTYERSTVCSFWFMIHSLFGKTTIATFPGGSVVIEGNGYLTFGIRSVFCPLKAWHLFTFQTNEKGNQRIISGYLDGNKISDVNTTDDMLVVLGNDEECNAIWFISPYLHPVNHQLEVDDIKVIYNNGPHFRTQKQMKALKGVRYVPYQGILRYMNLFGGPTFIFELMSKADSKESFLLYLQSAFNLYKLKTMEPELFFTSLRLVLRLTNLFSPQIGQMFMHEMDTPNGYDWKNLSYVFCDYKLLSSVQLQNSFLTRIMDKPFNKDAVVFFHYLLDTYVFFNLTPDNENFILSTVERFIKFQPSLIQKLPLVLMSIPHCDDDHFKPDHDTRQLGKQIKLFNLWIKDKNLFISSHPGSTVFPLCSRMPIDISLKMFCFIADIVCEKPSYFDLSTFKKVVLTLQKFVKEEMLWISLLKLLTQKSSNQIEDFLAFDVACPELIQYMFDLLTILLPYDFENPTENAISFRIIHLLHSLMITQNFTYFKYIRSIQNLCSIGYGERPMAQLPFSLAKKAPVQQRRVTRPRFFRPSLDSFSEDSKEKIIKDMFKELDCNLFDVALQNLDNNSVELSQFADLEVPTVDEPKNLDEIMALSVVDFISIIAAKTFVETNGDLNNFKKTLISLTIFGADVYPPVAIAMHKKVIFALLEQKANLSNESFFYVVEFLTNRIIEGWWDGQVPELFSHIVPHFTIAHKAIAPFVLTCLAQVHDNYKMAQSILKSFLFHDLFSPQNIQNAFLHLVVTVENAEHHPEMISQLVKTFKISNLKPDNVIQYIQSNPQLATSFADYMSTLTSIATQNAITVANERLDITQKSRETNLIRHYRSFQVQVISVRRAFRFEFAYRLNFASAILTRTIAHHFRVELLLKHSSEEPTRFSVQTNPHPLTVPVKLIPHLYPYTTDCSKVITAMDIPVSEYVHEYDTFFKEVNRIIKAPLCLKGKNIPVFLDNSITPVLHDVYNAQGDFFNLNLLISTELLPCVGFFAGSSLNLLLNSKVEKGLVSLLPTEMICHYPVMENAMCGLLGENSLFMNHPMIIIPQHIVSLVQPRKYCHQPLAIDLFTAHGFHYSIVTSAENRKLILSKFKSISMIASKRGQPFANRLLTKSPEFNSKLWVNKQISTFDYLLYLNAIGDRSFTDFAQYPVFPWTLCDFESPSNRIRDLTKPMGDLSPERSIKYETIYNDTEQHYFYGTHYSYPAAVMHYLMRVDPTTLYNVMLHNGFDHPDRLFCSFSESWRSASETNQADVKELIPEMYCFPEALENVNNLPLPQRTDGTNTENVILPPWASSSLEFTWTMRSVLESEEVSAKINNWIDLIFGYKQTGQPAIDAKNVFHPLTYDNATRNPEAEDAETDTINNFGQCPLQVFTKPHPTQTNPKKQTLGNMDIKICTIKPLPRHIRSFRVIDEEPNPAPKLQHYVSYHPVLAIVNDGMISIGGKYHYTDYIFDLQDSAISGDGTLLGVVTKDGYALIFWTVRFSLLTRTILPGVSLRTIAVSSHYSEFVIATEEELLLYDIAGGFLMRKYPVSGVNFLSFDETNDFIVAATTNQLVVLSLNFQLMATAEAHTEITSISTGDGILWCPKPMFATGHADGSIFLWEINIYEKIIVAQPLCKALHDPVVAIKIFAGNKALICCDDDGNALTISVTHMKRNILKLNYFDKCALCGLPIDKDTVLCSNCHLPVCKNCISIENEKMCVACKAILEYEDESSIPPSLSFYDESFKMSYESQKSNGSLDRINEFK